MKAIVVRAFTEFDRAEVAEMPDPTARPGQVVVELEASDTNFPDILYIEGKYQRLPPFPFVPGLAGAGRVCATGEGVDSGLIGRKMLVLPENGTFAARIAAPLSHCLAVPEEVPSTIAAAFGLAYQTAWFALTDRARIAEGDVVLVLGATGGIGMAAMQIAKAVGASLVIGASRGHGGCTLAREMGADVAIDSSMADLRDGLRDAVLAATDGRGADVVIDPVGGDLSAAALRAMAWSGRYVVVGFASGEVPKFAANYLLVKNISVSGIQWTDYRQRRSHEIGEAQERIFNLWRAGRLAPRISATYPLENYAKALSALRSGRAGGKIILKISNKDVMP